MSAAGGRASGLQEIPPAPPTYKPRWKEPAQSHKFHMYRVLRDLEYTASREVPWGATVRVLMAYAHFTDADGATRASLREMADHLNLSVGTVHRHVKRLVELGFLEQLGDCREGNRHRPWRVAGMDRREYINLAPGEKHHRSGTSARAGGERKAMDVTSVARAGGERILLPGELHEKTRASTQQELLSPRDWGRANDPAGIRESREALRARRAAGGAPGAPEPPAAASDAPAVPDAVLGAQNATEDATEDTI
jgi:Winged helix-turn-helix DNA-binding